MKTPLVLTREQLSEGYFIFYCRECNEGYATRNEFRCICPSCANEMGMPAETKENPYPGFFGDFN